MRQGEEIFKCAKRSNRKRVRKGMKEWSKQIVRGRLFPMM
jgi:hypothetical protein